MEPFVDSYGAIRLFGYEAIRLLQVVAHGPWNVSLVDFQQHLLFSLCPYTTVPILATQNGVCVSVLKSVCVCVCFRRFQVVVANQRCHTLALTCSFSFTCPIFAAGYMSHLLLMPFRNSHQHEHTKQIARKHQNQEDARHTFIENCLTHSSPTSFRDQKSPGSDVEKS